MSLIPSAKDLAGALAPVLQQSIQQLADVEPGVLQAVVEDALAKVASTDIPALQAATPTAIGLRAGPLPWSTVVHIPGQPDTPSDAVLCLDIADLKLKVLKRDGTIAILG